MNMYSFYFVENQAITLLTIAFITSIQDVFFLKSVNKIIYILFF